MENYIGPRESLQSISRNEDKLTAFKRLVKESLVDMEIVVKAILEWAKNPSRDRGQILEVVKILKTMKESLQGI